jgi:hypothetical protein
LKALLRGRAERKIDALCDAVGTLIPASFLQNAPTTSELPDMTRIEQDILEIAQSLKDADCRERGIESAGADFRHAPDLPRQNRARMGAEARRVREKS